VYIVFFVARPSASISSIAALTVSYNQGEKSITPEPSAIDQCTEYSCPKSAAEKYKLHEKSTRQKLE
jgi:hypothetical protein